MKPKLAESQRNDFVKHHVPLLSFPSTENSKYLLLSRGLYRLNMVFPVLGWRRKVVRIKSSVTPCSAKPPCSRSGRQSGDVKRLYTAGRTLLKCYISVTATQSILFTNM